MKYEKFDKNGVDYIRITINEHEVVERPLVDADKSLFTEGDTYEPETPPNEPVPHEPYPEGP